MANQRVNWAQLHQEALELAEEGTKRFTEHLLRLNKASTSFLSERLGKRAAHAGHEADVEQLS